MFGNNAHSTPELMGNFLLGCEKDFAEFQKYAIMETVSIVPGRMARAEPERKEQ